MAQLTYLDFDLLVERWQDQYKAHAINSPAGQANSVFRLPFSEAELNGLLLHLGQSRRRARHLQAAQDPRAAEVSAMETAKAFGGRLYETVFTEQMHGCLRASLDEAQRRGAGLRIRLRLTEAPELADLPWEYLYHAALNRFLSLSAQTPIVRYLDLAERIRPLAVQPPLKILAVISSPYDLPRLEVEQEWEKLREALGDLQRRKLVALEKLEEATLPALQKLLRRTECHVFHFIGHGEFDQQRQDGALIFEDEQEQGQPVRGQYLGTLLHDHGPLRLAVLNACEGGHAARANPFAGAAPSLVQQGVPAVIAMQFPVTDAAAITFSHNFYGALADGYPVDAALSEARKAIFSQGNETEAEWGTPVLFMRAADGKIFDVAASSADAGKSKNEDGDKGEEKRKTELPATVQQSASDVGGQVIQAGRDVIITGDAVGRDVINREVTPTDEGNIGKRLALWLGIVATVVTIITGIVQLWPDVAPKSSQFFGDVYDAQQPERGVDGAEIEVRAESGGAVIGKGKTNGRGEFRFPLKINWEETVFVTVFKHDSVGCDTTLIVQGNQHIPFKPFKRKP